MESERTMPKDLHQSLESLLSSDEPVKGDVEAALEVLIRAAFTSDARCLGRTTDGVEHVRWIRREPGLAQVCAKVWELPDSALHTLWLTVARATDGRVGWTLNYDIDPATTSRPFERNVGLLKDGTPPLQKHAPLPASA